LNSFLSNSGKSLPALDAPATQSLKTLHRLFQVTPSTESLQAAMSLGFTSARDIASYPQDEFMAKYAHAFPPGEAVFVHGYSVTVSSVTFNVFTSAKQLDTAPPVFAVSPSNGARQDAKNTLVKHFPSMASLFGNLDFCQCEDCRSVLSPAAYFVDLLDLLGQNSAPNAAGNTPLDVLIGGKALPGRRPDLAALPLTCENTNTALPYIDLVNEILEYDIAHSALDSGAAYDTGSATTADLIAEPQHILPQVYSTTLKQAVYPLNLPFDLWIGTVRGFLRYFKISLAQVLDAFRPADTLELFTSGVPTPYYQAQILAEALGISPAEYAVFTSLDKANWFKLYGAYANEGAALADLKSAKTLSQRLGLSYQDLVDLMTTGFLNPLLYPLLFQFQRFGIEMSDAFSFTGQPGYSPLVDKPGDNPPTHAKTDFDNLLKSITSQYKALNPDSTFDAATWLTNLLPANYSTKVLVLADPNTGCDFTGTTVQYADGSPATPLDFLKLNLFVRIWKKLGWSLDETDRALQTFFPPNLPAFTDAGFAAAFNAAWKTALVYLAHLDDLNTRLAPALGRTALLPLWTTLLTQGTDPLYAQLFLTPSVLNNDFAFDDPNGQFPWLASDLKPEARLLSAHQTAVQGVLSLTAAEITAILADAGVAGPAQFTLANLSLCYRYSLLAQCLQLPVSDMLALKTMAALNPFQAISATPLAVLNDDVLLNQTLAFAKTVATVQNSGFTVEDVKYLLRHQFDPVGKYQTDPNALIALAQSVGAGLRQIKAQNTAPASFSGVSESLIDQTLSSLFPAPILKTLFIQLTNSQTYTATATVQTVAAMDPAPFAQETALTFSWDNVTHFQSISYKGYLLDRTKTNLKLIDNTQPFDGLLDAMQAQAQAALDKSIDDILGVWGQQQTPSVYSELIGTLIAMWVNAQTFTATQAGAQIDAAAFSAALAAAQQSGTISGPVPVIHFSFDSTAGIQTLTCQGVLTEALRPLLAALTPAPLLPGLLLDVRSRAAQLFQTLATGLFVPAPTDLDKFSAPFLGVDPAKLQKPAKEELVKVFLPLLAQKLSRQLVIQTLSASQNSPLSLTEALVTDAALLSDPANPGKPLLGAFLAAGQPGVSATFDALPTATVSTTDTAGSVPAKAHFEGYLQVSTDGPYRFFAELGNLGAQVAFRLDSPDPAALFPNPILQQTAVKDGDEASQFVALKGGVPYHFTLDFQSLGPKGASLLVQGETLPKGPLSQVVLVPQDAISGFTGANVLLSKVLQILQVTGLDEREVSYLTANAAQFSNFKLSVLPTRAQDDSVPNATALFSQFLTLADYANLRKGPAGGTDGLVDVFQAASQIAPPTPPWSLLANLTRRNSQVVQDLAAALGPDPHFLNNIGIRRIWDALQLLQILRLPVASVTASTAIVASAPPNPDAIAANFKNAVKAQYTPAQWRPIAKSVFDPLRQKKRDALVAYLMNLKGFDSSNQLFEYFLVDPGMEPVVQTSRIRLALSAVQTFVQRCLLNLENGNPVPATNVAPSAIRADWWDWMKRYRVWQANREIFLFPENWMEPELRLDKTDLFQALEGELLQGDVTSDLVEDAFLTYLKGLDVRARLDVVATYLDQDTQDAGFSTLYVLGRTFGHPHKYFYRTYSQGAWLGWQAVTLDIESDHIALALWRGRLNVFWLTFVIKAQAPPAPSGHGATGVGSLRFDDLTSDIFSAKPQKQVQVQLHWSEFVQGKWTTRISTDVNKSDAIDVLDGFETRNVHIHVSKETDSSGAEGAIKIHVDFPDLGPLYSLFNQQANIFKSIGRMDIYAEFASQAAALRPFASRAFRVTSKNCDPDFNPDYWEQAPFQPYTTNGVDATFYTGSSSLTAFFQSRIQADGSSTTTHENILNQVDNFELLTVANPVVPPLLPPGDPLLSEAGGLVSPFFFKDASNSGAGGQSAFHDERTFFVLPSLTEKVVEEWPGYAIGPSFPATNWFNPNYVDSIPVVAQVPAAGPIPPNPGDPVYSVYPMQSLADWATHPAVAISYGGASIGKNGGIQTGAISNAAAGAAGLASAGAGRLATGGLLVVGRQGLSLGQVQSVQLSQRGSLAANVNALSLPGKF
jgi:hypothetical protein